MSEGIDDRPVAEILAGMPNVVTPNAQFSEAEVQSVITSKLPNPVCSLCGGKQWTIVPGFVHLVCNDDISVNVLAERAKAASCVGIVCTNCGDTHLLNILRLGLVKAD